MEPYLAYLTVGILLALIGILDIGKGSKKMKRCTASTTAVVVEVQSETDEAERENTHKKVIYTPIFEFTANGISVRKSGGVYSHNKKEFRVGDTVTVRYNPTKPEEFSPNGKAAGKAFGIVLMLFGLLLIIIGITQI